MWSYLHRCARGLIRGPVLVALFVAALVLGVLPAGANQPHVLWARGQMYPWAAMISPNRGIIAVANEESDNPGVLFLDTATGRTLDFAPVWSRFLRETQICWGPDSASLFLAHDDGIYRYNLASRNWARLAALPESLHWPDHVAVSPNGSRLVVGKQTEFAFLDLSTNAISPVYGTGLSFNATNWQWLPDSSAVVSDGPNVFNLSGTRVLTNTAGITSSFGFDLSPDGSRFAFYYSDSSGTSRLRVTNMAANTHAWTIALSNAEPKPAFLGAGERIAMLGSYDVQVRSAANGALAATLNTEFTADIENRFRMVAKGGRSIYTVYPRPGGDVVRMEQAEFSSDFSSWRIANSWNILDNGSWLQTTQAPVNGSPVHGVGTTGWTLSSADQTTSVVWSQSTGAPIRTISVDDPNSMCFSPNGERLVVDNFQRLRLFNPGTGSLLGEYAFASGTHSTPFVLQAANSGRIFYHESSNTVRVYDPGTGGALTRIRAFAGARKNIRSHMSPSGNVVVLECVNYDSRVSVMNVATGSRISAFSTNQSSEIKVVRLMSDTELFTLSQTGTSLKAEVWNVSASSPSLLRSVTVGRSSARDSGFESSADVAPNGEFVVIGQRWDNGSGNVDRNGSRIDVVRFDGSVLLRNHNNLMPGTTMKEVVISPDSRVAYIRNGRRSVYALNVFIPNRVMSLSLNPASLKGGRTSTGTVGIEFPAPTGGVRVDLASSNTAAATVPASVTVPAGATTATFTVATSAVRSDTTVNITASRPEAGSQTASLQVQRPLPIALTLNPTSIRGGQSSTATVTLDGAAPSGGLVLSLRSNRTEATVPATATVPAGATSVTFTINTVKVGAITYPTIYATANSVTRFALLTVRPPVITGLTFNPATVFHGGTSTGTVTIDEAAPSGGVRVTLRSTRPSVANGPAFVDIPEGATQATFAATTSTVGVISSATFVATVGTVTVGRGLTVLPPLLTGMTISPGSVTGGQNATVTVTIEAPAPAGGVRVDLRSSQAAAIVPASMTIPQGQTSATFTVRTTTVASRVTAQVYATIAGRARFVQLVINP